MSKDRVFPAIEIIRTAFINELEKARSDAVRRSQNALEIGSLSEGANQSKSDTTKHQLGLEQDAAIETFRNIDLFLGNANQEIPLAEHRDQVVIGSVAVLKSDLIQEREAFFIVPRFGGIKFEVDGCAIQSLSIDSPLGSKILGKRVGWSMVIDSDDEAETTSLIELI